MKLLSESLYEWDNLALREYEEEEEREGKEEERSSVSNAVHTSKSILHWWVD